MASPSASYGIGNNYSAFDIFINHRGPDVKKGLATHLYQRLSAHGLRVFLDKEELQAGDNLTPQINGAIKTASVHIAIFSPRYAESSWCLDELAQILESQRTIIPVFYNVNPSELRWTRGGQGVYARALGILEKRTYDSQPRYDSRTLAKWRKALCDVAEISGFELKECNGDEGQLTDKVVHQVLKRVTKTPLNVAKYPTGLDEKVEDLERTVFLQQQSEKARVVGIVGLGGVGKTTLAKEFFNSHRSNYDRSCFLFDVRENAAKSSLNLLQRTLIKELAQSDVHISSTDEGIEELKRHLSPSHRSLIVLDDVDHISQLDALFLPLKYTIHSSSLILVTSRNKDILTSSGIIESFIYKQTGLNQQHSRELFCSHVFDQPYPVTEFERLVKKFLDVCDGLPLSIKVIGALLCGKDLEYWEAQLHKISKVPPRDILSRLKISYDSLDDDEKNIFLDIACFFIGEDRNTAIRIWDGSDWQGWLSLRNLESKCLVEVDSENCMRMHDHLRDLGRDIAKKETPYRLWHSADYLLHNLRDQSYVRGVSMVHGNGPEQSFEIPKNMRRLELLRTEGHRVKDILSDAQSPQLVWLCWYSCPFSSLPSWISVKNLRVLYIQGGKLDTLWQHESEAPLQLRELKIDANLSEVPKSIGKLKHLEKIVLCWKKYIGGETVDPVDLETLPDEVSGMENLKHLELESCKNMRLLPDSAGNWRKLQWIVLGWCSALQGLPDSAGNWTKLQRIDLRWCSALQGLPDSTGNWANLHHVNLRGCSALQRLPESAGNWTNLHHIDLGGCVALQGLPDSAGNWTNLHHIDLGRCSALQGLPDSAGNWTNLHRINLYQCSAFQRLPDSAGNWTSLQHIDLGWCSALQGLPDSAGNWTNLQRIDLGGCSALQRLPDSAGNWTNLQRIDLGFCSALQDLPDSAGNWTFLQRIDLTGCSALQVLPDSSGEWTNLQHIDLGWCSALQVLPDSAGNWTFLKRLDLAWCSALQGLPASLLNWTHLESMDWTGCSALGLLRFVRAPRYRPELQVTETYRLGPVLRFAGAAPLRDVKEGAITKRMTAIEEMAGMDVLCSDKTGTLTLNKLQKPIEGFCKRN